MKSTILVDADGVLVNFVDSFLAVANGISGLSLTYTDVVEWDIFKPFPEKFHAEISAAIEAPGFCLGMSDLPGAVAGLDRLRTLGDVVCVTSPMATKTWVWERTEWLIRHAGFKSKEIIHASAKHHVRGAVLIDDKYETLVDWKFHNYNGDAILWHAPYNASINQDLGIWRAKSWDDVYSLTRAAIFGQQAITGARPA